MRQDKLEIPMPGGSAEAYLFHADGASRPGVLFLTDIMGIREANLGMARRVAEHGYTVLVPNAFWRASKLPLFDFPPQIGEERTMKRFGELRAGLTNQQMGPDGAAFVDFLLEQPQVAGAKVGVVGYCFTGQMALRIAAEAPDKIAAAASFHGGHLWTDAQDSPHKLLPRVTARLYFGHAIEDRTMMAEQIAHLDAALNAWGGRFESETYEGAHHGWTVPGRDIYNAKQAERHYAKLFETFDAVLK